jgi:hypothetical protein
MLEKIIYNSESVEEYSQFYLVSKIDSLIFAF